MTLHENVDLHIADEDHWFLLYYAFEDRHNGRHQAITGMHTMMTETPIVITVNMSGCAPSSLRRRRKNKFSFVHLSMRFLPKGTVLTSTPSHFSPLRLHRAPSWSLKENQLLHLRNHVTLRANHLRLLDERIV